MTQREICEKEGPHFSGGSELFPRIASCCIQVWRECNYYEYNPPNNPRKSQIFRGEVIGGKYWQLISLELVAYFEELRHPCRIEGPHMFFAEDGSLKLKLDCRCKELWSVGYGGFRCKEYRPKEK